MRDSDIKIDLLIAGFAVVLVGMFSAAVMVIGLGRSAAILGISVNSSFESYLIFIVINTAILIPVGVVLLALYRRLNPRLKHA